MIYREPGFSPLYDLAPPPPLPLSHKQVVSLSQFSYVSLVELILMEEGVGGGKESNHTTARNLGPL
jgi:hypothetical protein